MREGVPLLVYAWADDEYANPAPTSALLTLTPAFAQALLGRMDLLAALQAADPNLRHLVYYADKDALVWLGNLPSGYLSEEQEDALSEGDLLLCVPDAGKTTLLPKAHVLHDETTHCHVCEDSVTWIGLTAACEYRTLDLPRDLIARIVRGDDPGLESPAGDAALAAGATGR